MTRIKHVLFVSVTASVLSAGLLMWKAEATPLAGSVEPFTINQSVSPVLKAGCMFGTSRCPAGNKWVCTAPAQPRNASARPARRHLKKADVPATEAKRIALGAIWLGRHIATARSREIAESF